MATLLTWLARAARIVEQPPFWGAVATALTIKGGTRGRQAALRGSVCYVVAAFIANIVIKPLVHRHRPQGAGDGRIGPYTFSFPSGHTGVNPCVDTAKRGRSSLVGRLSGRGARLRAWSRPRSHQLEEAALAAVLVAGAQPGVTGERGQRVESDHRPWEAWVCGGAFGVVQPGGAPPQSRAWGVGVGGGLGQYRPARSEQSGAPA